MFFFRLTPCDSYCDASELFVIETKEQAEEWIGLGSRHAPARPATEDDILLILSRKYEEIKYDGIPNGV